MEVLFDQADHFLCHYTFVIDSYSKYCDIGCYYCYAKDFKSSDQFQIDLASIRAYFEEAKDTKNKKIIHHLIRKQVPIRLGFSTDPFQNIEKQERKTQKLLAIFKEFNHPCIIFTKSDLILDEIYKDLLSPELTNVQISLSSFKEELTDSIEPNAISPSSRIKIVKELGKRDILALLRYNILPPIMKGMDCYTTLHDYLQEEAEAIKKSNVKNLIVNSIYYRNNSPDIDEEVWSNFKSKLKKDEVNVSYCYLGGKSSLYYEYNRGLESNCCLCNLKPNDTRNAIGFGTIVKSGGIIKVIPLILKTIILRFSNWILKRTVE